MDGYGLGEFIRVTVGVKEQNERFVRALKRELAADERR
jgi:histidinol-phosphate/aromatic aminotransferase/cobyric acid decarboxylase-like protein